MTYLSQCPGPLRDAPAALSVPLPRLCQLVLHRAELDELLLELCVEILLSAGDLLESARDLVVKFVEVGVSLLEGRVNARLVKVHLFDVHAPVLQPRCNFK